MISFDNIRYYTGSYNEFADFVLMKFNNNSYEKLIIVHINLRNLYYLSRDPVLKDSIRRYCIVVFDGIGMKTGLWLKGYGLYNDINGTDLFPHLMCRIEKTNLRVFLLGAKDTVIRDAAKNLKKKYPSLNLSGYHHGFFPKNEETSIIEKINQSNSNILIIGRGFPLQEQFVLKHKDKLNVRMIWNVGGLFDFVSGSKQRAPQLLRKLRLEWFFRLLIEPRRMLYRNTVCAFWSLGHIMLKKKTA